MLKKNHYWACTNCGGTRLNQDAWVDPNTEKVIATFDDFYCKDCDTQCQIEQRPIKEKK
mgnify:FL=1